MKQFLFLLGIGLAITNAAQAQVGLRLGGSASKLHTTDDGIMHNSSRAKLGFQAGLTYQVSLTKWLAVVPEVQYSQEQMGLAQVNYAIADAGFSADSRLRLHYLNVPVLVRASLGPVYVEAGPQVSMLLGGRQVGTATVFSGWTGTSTSYDLDESLTDHYRRFDAGPCVGVGIMLPAGLGLSVRAYKGLVTLNHEQGNYEGGYQRQSLQASLTYQLPTH
jgi:hypothetical protein